MELRAIDHYRAYAKADQAPEPDALHGSIDRLIECGINDDGRDVTGNEQEQTGPRGVPAAASAPHRAHQHTRPRNDDGPPERQAWNATPRQDCHMHAVRTSQWPHTAYVAEAIRLGQI